MRYIGTDNYYYNLALMVPHLWKGDLAGLDSAKGIFAILGGWGGIILGYYFGRITAEKATDNANAAADKARNDATQANANKARAIMEANEQLAKAKNVLTRVANRAPNSK